MADNMLRSDPLADLIYDFIWGSRKFKILNQAVELGLFDDVDALGESATVAELSRKWPNNPDVLERLLEALVGVKLLNKTKVTGMVVYHNSPSAQKYLIRSRRTSMVYAVIRNNSALDDLDDFSMILHTGTSDRRVVDAMYGVTVDTTDCGTEVRRNSLNVDSKYDHSSPVTKRSLSPVAMFMLGMDGYTGPALAPIARAFDLSGHKKVVDLGGGSGLVAYELSRTYLRMHVTVFDIPQVVQLAKDLQEKDTKDRVTFVAGDFFKDPFPPADLYILSHILHDWDKEKGDILLRKVFDSLPSGGRLILLEKIVNEDHAGPVEAVLMDMVMAAISKGRERSASEYRQWLEEHSFMNTLIQRIDGPNLQDVIITQKPF